MKNLLLVLLLPFVFLSCERKQSEYTQAQIDSISTYTGTFTAWTLKDFGSKEFNSKAFRAGMEKVFTTDDTTLTLSDADVNIGYHFEKLRVRQNQNQEKEGRAFLVKNGNEQGVVTTSTGLQYRMLQTGEGRKARLNDIVVVHYTGALIDGTVFAEQAYDTLIVNDEQMLPGWVEALQLMNVNTKAQIFLSPELAFGKKAVPYMKPNLTLIYDIQLINILSKP